MIGKAVNIYAYSNTRGVFFYNGTNATRDTIDALIEDSKVSLKPKYEGYKITKIDGLDPETEFFTSEKGVGHGVFVTGSRMPEHYVDIVAVGAGGENTEAYYNYAHDFHHIGEYYYLNLQYQGRWVKAYGMLKNFKITPQNVYKRTEITVSFMIINPSLDSNWHTVFPMNKLPKPDTSGTNPASTDIIDMGLRNAGWPVAKITAIFGGLNITADSFAHRGQIRIYFTYRTADGKLIDDYADDNPWNVLYYYQTGTGSDRKVNIGSTAYSGKTLSSSSPTQLPYIQVKLKTNPTNKKYSIYAVLADASSGALCDPIEIADGASWPSTRAPEPIEIETMKVVITKDGDGTVRWEADT